MNTIRTWRNHRASRARKPLLRGDESLLSDDEVCDRCGARVHDFAALPLQTYAYALGIYLGDGYIVRNSSSWMLRVTLDAIYPGIIREVCGALAGLREGRWPIVRPRSQQHCVTVESTWQAWTCLFPQHGAGRKHNRQIALAAWQVEIVDAAPGSFLRGLIHTDGWRGVNRVHVKGRDYQYPRYQFSNRSDDIRALFTTACDKLGVKWRPWTRYHISVAQQESVAVLDSFVGPKY